MDAPAKQPHARRGASQRNAPKTIGTQPNRSAVKAFGVARFHPGVSVSLVAARQQ